MNQQTTNDTENGNNKSIHAVLVGVILTVCVFIGVSVFSFDGPSILVPSTHADPVWPSGPADLQIAQLYGRIDHSSLMSPDIFPEPEPEPEPEPAPAAIAAYETPPQ